jgi:hypothetical protein
MVGIFATNKTHASISTSRSEADARKLACFRYNTVRPVTSVRLHWRYRRGMMALREIMIWIIQAVLFGIGIGFAGLTAHLAGPLLATAFAIDELIPTAIVFFAVTAGLGWIGNRFWPEEWLFNPLL